MMRYVIEDTKYCFKYAFDTETGAYVRTGILDDKGRDTGKDPFQASFPHLIDVELWGTAFMARRDSAPRLVWVATKVDYGKKSPI